MQWLGYALEGAEFNSPHYQNFSLVHKFQTGWGTHQGSCSTDQGSSFPRDKGASEYTEILPLTSAKGWVS